MKPVRRFVERLASSDCTVPALVLALTAGGLLAWSILSLHIHLH